MVGKNSNRMKSGLLMCCLLLGLSQFGLTESFDLVFKDRAGTALSALTVYSDSMFTKPTRHSFSSGQLLEIIGETELEHEDDAQKQTFKWYQVRATDGLEGWVFGDGLAVILPEAHLDPAVRAFHKKKMEFGTGFEQAILWMAAIEGHDNFHRGGLLNPVYSETYLVITNRRGRSIPIYFGGENTQGIIRLQEMQFQELTGDAAPELILLRQYRTDQDQKEVRNLELYSFQAGTMQKVFDERLNLPVREGLQNPCPYKFVELDEGIIRVEYVELKNCDQYALSLKTGIHGASADRCLEYITYSYHWDHRKKNYQLLYEESRSAPQVRVNVPGVFLQENPDASARRIRSIRPQERIDVIRQQEVWLTERGKQRREAYFYVRLPEGAYGYIPVRFTNFTEMAHARQLDHYYQHPSTSAKAQDLSFFSVRGVRSDSSAFHQR